MTWTQSNTNSQNTFFFQSAWLQTYIDFNTQKKKKKTVRQNFLRFFFQAYEQFDIYGKFLQNVRKYQNFVLVHRQLHFKREVAKSRFEYFTICL